MPAYRPHLRNELYAVGIWDVSESLHFLMNEVGKEGFRLDGQQSIKSELKKRQWLAARLLIRSVEPAIKDVRYLDSRAPYLDEGWHISLSHSANRVAVMLSDQEIPGIDIQEISQKIIRIQEKFASKEEMMEAEGERQIEKLNLIWSAKEAVFKKCREAGLVFSEDILIRPFNCQGSGMLNARVRLHSEWQEMKLNYELIDNYSLVYTLIG